MTRTINPDSDWWGPQEDRRATVDRLLGKIGISLNDPRPMPGAAVASGPGGVSSAAWLKERDGFLRVAETGAVISPTLAAKMHYKPRPTAAPAPASPTTSEADSLEGMRR